MLILCFKFTNMIFNFKNNCWLYSNVFIHITQRELYFVFFQSVSWFGFIYSFDSRYQNISNHHYIYLHLHMEGDKKIDR